MSVTTTSTDSVGLWIVSGASCATPAVPGFNGQEIIFGTPALTTTDWATGGTVATQDANVSTTTTYCLIGKALYSAGSFSADGQIFARQVK